MLNKTNLARIDLNLLVLFEAVLEERHVGRAAGRLHVSPSAVSHGLGRLRRLMHDPLFLRQPKGVVPTERARLLAAPIADILERARQVLDEAEAFDPARSARRFMIGAPDGASSVILPALLAEVRRSAPGIDLGVRNLVAQFDAAFAGLDERTLDVALLPVRDVPARFVARTLYDEDFVLVRRAGSPTARTMNVANYVAAPHLVVSTSGDPQGPIDKELAKRGLSRRVVLTVSNFMQALAIVAESDLICALPRQFVAKHGPRYKVITSEPPFPFLSSPIRAIVPQAAISDGGLAWLLDAIERAAKVARSRASKK
ncbi:MAG TPA: LysR substrate-binding domain-containing protein [Steroidobacteraceae bacterium]|nr:LysR substrate-binding domain-containing protein [Steroidobacteraceae bacterium]